MRYETERDTFDIRDRETKYQVVLIPNRGAKIGTGQYLADFNTLEEAKRFCNRYDGDHPTAETH